MALISVATPGAACATLPSYYACLERGDIVFVPEWATAWGVDVAPLLAHDTVGGTHKNIAYDPRRDRVIGIRGHGAGTVARVRTILRTYSTAMTAALARLLPRYAEHWTVDITSFRPCEEGGRSLPLLQRNDLLHTDAFPSRPTSGARILRAFTNIHPSRPRRWVTAGDLSYLVQRFSTVAGFPRPRRRWRPQLLRACGLPALTRSPYDAFMLRLHDFLKTSAEYQATCVKEVSDFPPQSSWVLFTDYVPHAALSGQFALEQTYIVPTHAMVDPERSPLRILERWCGMPLVHGGSR
jgi:hypothetical protein